MNLAQLLARAARVHGDLPAVYLGTSLLHDYRGLAARAAAIAGGLRNRAGLASGDRVALFMTNSPEYLEAMYGAWWAGLVIVPINAKLHPREAAFILDHAQAGALFISPELSAGLLPLLGSAPSVRHVFETGTGGYRALLGAAPLPPASRRPEDLAWLFYTSGTTGRPKGVMQTNRMLLAMTACYFSDVDAVDVRDATVYAAPMSHGAGLYSLPHMMAAARHVIPESGAFDPAELAGLARGLDRLSMFAAPTMVKRLVSRIESAGDDPAGFKTIVYGGGPMYVEDIRNALAVMGDRFVQIYGQGESPMTITALSRRQLADRGHPRWPARLASVGVAQSQVEVRVADAHGAPLPAGEIGEVQVRGDVVMGGYWRDPDASARTLRGGWLWTGDVGLMDDEGFLTLKDRSKDVIISGGSNIYPREIEEVLLTHPGVAEVAVVGAPDPEWGEEVVAFVVPRNGPEPTQAELDRLCLAHIARFKRPKRYRFVDALPKNNYGKVLKTELKAALAGRNEPTPPKETT
ncbi:AMP-dependent synthetase [Pigmentiphaga sp. NML080357]|uniref:class I adenylate-forming enzyme family protein n=1 Tax=Pigmentiphaga sp. NML080357 TaxID=2008675 RepID=UPI000B418F12|nr:AMP-binding protein [Pigmentiphaga sp. NML080357]OVZ56641.1 AMP-dependent synthetase [Pigmentiphaga sp. NML080357]